VTVFCQIISGQDLRTELNQYGGVENVINVGFKDHLKMKR